MKKILFSDRFGLTEAVLEGRKTMTRRIIKAPRTMDGKDVYGFSVVRNPQTEEVVEVMALDAEGAQINNILPKYKVGEVVAVAQAYHTLNKAGFVAPEWCEHTCEDSPGYSNKMFVRADLMPYQIRITNIYVQSLQDISDQDCIREGIEVEDFRGDYRWGFYTGFFTTNRGQGCKSVWCNSPQKAFAALIDKVSGKGTWQSNPWVFVYEFELIK